MTELEYQIRQEIAQTILQESLLPLHMIAHWCGLTQQDVAHLSKQVQRTTRFHLPTSHTAPPYIARGCSLCLFVLNRKDAHQAKLSAEKWEYVPVPLYPGFGW